MDDFDKKQLEIVEFSEKINSSGLKHGGINGTLCESKLLRNLRSEIPELTFYIGQIVSNGNTSPQYDIIICKKGTKQKDFLVPYSDTINIVDKEDCLGVIELKKWSSRNMILEGGIIDKACSSFKKEFSELKYYFVCLNFHDAKNNWKELQGNLKTDGNFCFFGKFKSNQWKFPWSEDQEIIKRIETYSGEYKNLISSIKCLAIKA